MLFFLKTSYREVLNVLKPVIIILNVILFLLSTFIIFKALDYQRALLVFYKTFNVQHEEMIQWIEFIAIFASYLIFVLIVGTFAILMKNRLLYLPCYYGLIILIASQFGIHLLLDPGINYLEHATRSKLNMLMQKHDKAKGNEMDKIQIELNCCGNKYYNDWTLLSKSIPGSCCGQAISNSCDSRPVHYSSGMPTKLACSDSIVWRLKHQYTFLSTLILISLFLQILLFALVSVLLYAWYRHIFLPPQKKYSLDDDAPGPPTLPPTTGTTTRPFRDNPCYPWGRTKRQLHRIRTEIAYRSSPPEVGFAQRVIRKPNERAFAHPRHKSACRRQC